MFVSNLCFLNSLLFRFFLIICPAHTSLPVSLSMHICTLQSIYLCNSFETFSSCFITVFLYCAVKIDGRKVGGRFWSESAYMFLLGVLHSSKPFTRAYYKNELNKTLQLDRRKNKKIRTTKKSCEIKKKKTQNKCFKLLSSYINWLIVFEK